VVEMIPVQSEAISRIGYDAPTKTARVEFRNDRTHDFPGVEPREHEELINAPSVGRHFCINWRGRNHTRIA
jgi:hypothetical protein